MASQDTTAKLQQVTNLQWLSASHIFGVAATGLAVAILPWRFLLSGAPMLTASILLGQANGYRILPFLNVWALLAVINFSYAIAATSWLLYWVYVSACYPTVVISCLYQFDVAGDFTRKYLRLILHMLDFVEDKIAFFELPALEIDTPDVKGGLMVIRGITISLSTLTIICHGIEVGIKLSDDMELALVTDEVRIEFFRRIHVGDCYGNLKGGEYEMTFGQLAPETRDDDGDHVMFESNTSILNAANKALDDESTHRRDSVDSSMGPGFSRVPTMPRGSEDFGGDAPQASISRASTLKSFMSADTFSGDTTPINNMSRATTKEDFLSSVPRGPPPPLPERRNSQSTLTGTSERKSTPMSPPPLPERVHPVKMIAKLTGRTEPSNDVSFNEAASGIKTLALDNEAAAKRYRTAINNIEETSSISQARSELETRHFGERYQGATRIIGDTFDAQDEHALKSATCSWLHTRPSIAHPSKRSIRVSTLQKMTPPKVSTFLHRLPFLFRLMLNPLAYFHPIAIDSITVGASGAWIQTMLQQHVFQQYPDGDAELRRIWTRLSDWLTDANFVMQLGKFGGSAGVPVATSSDITTHITFDDIMAYRAAGKVVKDSELKQVIRLGGADARINVPIFLLPHHEHLLPPVPSMEDRRVQEGEVRDAEGIPKTVQAESELNRLVNDQCTGKLSVHVRLPVVLDQELLNFVAALVKATKLIEMDKAGVSHPSSVPTDEEVEEKVDENLEKESSHGRFKSLHMNYLKEVKGFTTDLTKTVTGNIKHTIKRTTVDAMVNDRWIAKLVGKVAKQLENAMGDVGYSGDLPIALGPYRAIAEPYTKILP